MGLTRAKIVEELEERLAEDMDKVLDVVRNSLSEDAMQVETTTPTNGEVEVYEERLFLEEDEPWDQDANDVEFDDIGEGAGVEGDLEADEE